MSGEIRSLQRVAGGTYTVSVPKGWAVEHGLEAGSDVHLYARGDGSLVVRAAEGGALERTRLAVVDHTPDEIDRLLRAAHAVGFETITAIADPLSDDQRRAVRRTIRALVGTEPVEEDENRVVLRDLCDPAEVTVGRSLAEMCAVAVSVHRTATDAVAGGDDVDPDRLRRRADDVRRLAGMVDRHLNRSVERRERADALDVGRGELLDHCWAARELERVADHAVRLGRLAATDGEAAAADLTPVAEATRRVVDDATTALVDGSAAQAEAAVGRRDAVGERIADIERRLARRPDGTAMELRALDCLHRTTEAGGRIAEAALRRAVRPHDGER